MEADQLGRILWDYLHIGAPLERREAIVVFGGHDLRVAEWAAQLWVGGWVPILVCSGGLGLIRHDECFISSMRIVLAPGNSTRRRLTRRWSQS